MSGTQCESVRPGYTDRCERGQGHPGYHWARQKAVRWGVRYKRTDLATTGLDKDLAQDKAARKRSRRGPLCRICLEPAELDGGRCKDRAACLGRAPQLDLGLES